MPFHSDVAEVIEISGNASDGVRIEKVTRSVDCSVVVNPDVVKSQMEGGLGCGLGHAMGNKITVTDGANDRSNFPD